MGQSILNIFLVINLFIGGWVFDNTSDVSNPEIPDQVWHLTFEGNDEFTDMVLMEQIVTEDPSFWKKLQFWDRTGYELNETDVKKDAIRIQNYYQRRGFIHATVSYRIEDGNRSWKKHVYFEIDENEPVTVSTVNYQIRSKPGHSEEIFQSRRFQNAQEEQAFREGKRYQPIVEPEVRGLFTDALKNLGFAYANVNVETQIDSVNLAAEVTIEGVTGPKTYIDSIQVEGIQSISKGYILREANVHPGDLYTQEKLQEAQRQLFNHHLFRFATVSITEQPQDSSLTLLMRLRENEPRSLTLLAGVGTEEKLRGETSWTHRNIYRGHRFTTTAHASFIEQTLRLDYLLPYVFNTKSSFVISPFGQHLLENNFELLSIGVTNSFIYNHSDNLTASAAYEYTRNQELSQRFAVNLPDTATNYDLSALQFSGYYNEGYGRQREGWLIQPYAEISGFLGLATYTFQKLSMDVRRFIDLSNTTIAAARLQGGTIFNVATDTLPRNVRYYMGGTNSVRGWSRQELGPKRAQVNQSGFNQYIPLGGRSMAGFNLEIRQELPFIFNGLGFAVFLDGGQVWESVQSIGNRPLQFGSGGGLRYQSPLGPVRVDIGYKLNPMDEDLNIYNNINYGSAWDRFGIHFSIGQAF